MAMVSIVSIQTVHSSVKTLMNARMKTAANQTGSRSAVPEEVARISTEASNAPVQPATKPMMMVNAKTSMNAKSMELAATATNVRTQPEDSPVFAPRYVLLHFFLLETTILS